MKQKLTIGAIVLVAVLCGYPPEWDEEVFEKVLVQVKNYKQHQ